MKSLALLVVAIVGCTELEDEPDTLTTDASGLTVTTVNRRPARDTQKSNVTGVGDATSLYKNVDDGTGFSAADDGATYVRTASGVTNATHTTGYSLAVGGTVTQVLAKYRADRGNSSGTIQIELYNGTTLIKAGPVRTLGAWTNYTETFSGLALPASADLRLRVVLKKGSTNGYVRYTQIWLVATVTTSPDLLADDGFENGIDPEVYNVRVDGEGILEQSSAHAREGNYSMHTKVVRNGITNYRQEVRHRDGQNQTAMAGSPDYWLGVSIYLPSTASHVTQSVAYQWHNYYECCSPTIGLRVASGAWKITREVGTNSGIQLGPIATDEWTDWVFRVRWRTDNTGLVEVWQNGVKVWSETNIQTGLQHDTVQPYAKFGIYSSSWKFAGNDDPNGTVHERYHDAFRICNVAGCSYADVAPRGDRLAAD